MDRRLYVTPKEAGEMLGVTRGRVHQLIKNGKLRAEKFGPYYAVTVASVEERRHAPKDRGGGWRRSREVEYVE